jgi:hypothetical protein
MLEMEALFKFPTVNLLINTFLRSIVVIAVAILGFQSSWYVAYWSAVIHDGISLVLIRPYL